MEISIRPDGENAQELVSLKQWLSTQRGLGGRVRLVHTAPEAEQLSGAAFDLLAVSLGAGGTVSVLAGALSAWLGARGGRGAIEIEVDGRRLSVPEGTDPAEVERYIAMLVGQPSGN
ncbi:hypothetical protein [Streptomyces sp. NPDC058297]|uniref:effector-associated constant component EACC1 n=1 Tax=Streptomyces sp. NPDC058297 TaxID=3346433 RepID=UPI0036EC1F17